VGSLYAQEQTFPRARVPDEPIVIRELADLDLLRQLPPLVPRSARIEVSSLSIHDREFWEGLLNRELRKCGCREGQIVALVSLFVYMVSLFTVITVERLTAWQASGIGFAIVVVASLVGKGFGLWRARVHLGRLIQELKLAVLRVETPRRPNVLH